MIQEMRENSQYCFRMNDVEIVQDEDKWIGKGCQFIHQEGDDIFKLSWLDALEHAEQVILNILCKWQETRQTGIG